MKEELSFFETSILTRATRRNITEDAILHLNINSNKSELLNSPSFYRYTAIFCRFWNEGRILFSNESVTEGSYSGEYEEYDFMGFFAV
jgi:hypothetical protein